MSLCCADKARITNMHGTNEKKKIRHMNKILAGVSVYYHTSGANRYYCVTINNFFFPRFLSEEKVIITP